MSELPHIVERAAASRLRRICRDSDKHDQGACVCFIISRLVLAGLEAKFKITINPKHDDVEGGAKCLQMEDPTLRHVSWEDCPSDMKEYYKGIVFRDMQTLINAPHDQEHTS